MTWEQVKAIIAVIIVIIVIWALYAFSNVVGANLFK